MPKINFRKPRAPVDAHHGETLMKALLTAGLPVASSCRGEGVCAKCRIEVVSGMPNLSSETEIEIYLRDRHGLSKGERISEQVNRSWHRLKGRWADFKSWHIDGLCTDYALEAQEFFG